MMKSSDFPSSTAADTDNTTTDATTTTSEAATLLIPNGGGDDGPTQRKTTRPSAGTSPDGVARQRVVRKTRVRRKKAASSSQNSASCFIKYFALFLLIAQMVGMVLLMRYSRTHRDPNAPLYLASTAVFLMEVLKFVICVAVVAVNHGGNLAITVRDLYQNTIGAPQELLKLSVPSFMYTVQNNLLYLALTNLDAATYQVCYQLKILTTAIFSAWLLGRRFSPQKWVALLLLTVGVAVVQVFSDSSDDHHHTDATPTTSDDANNRMVGLVAVLSAACTSGFSGVYFERILKGSTTSLWIRNIQMGLPSIIISYITIYVKDSAAVREYGMLGGYNGLVWSVVIVQAVGGLIVATVVKYADNILKTFAASFSIIVSCLISAVLFDFHPSMAFLIGASLVVTATAMYSMPEKSSTSLRKTRRRRPVLPLTVATANATTTTTTGTGTTATTSTERVRRST